MAGATEQAGDATGTAACRNCGTRLAGPFCHECGQNAHVHTTLASVGHDLLHGAFHFEGRIWRTLPLLAFRPGQLTRRYIAGERARLVSPLALFLFGVLLLFAAIESVGPPLRPTVNIEHNGRKLSPSELDALIAADRARLARLDAREANSAGPVAADRALTEVKGDLAGLDRARRMADELQHPVNAIGGSDTEKGKGGATGWPRLDARISAARANPSLALVEVEANAHKFAWALIPLSVPFVWFVFWWRREWRLYDHVVFVTYSQSAVLLLLALMAGVGAIGLDSGLMLFLIPVHLFVQLRGAYRLRWWSALWRTAWLCASAVAVVSAFALIVLWLGTG